MFQATLITAPQSTDPESARPVIRLAQRLDDLKHIPAAQLGEDQAAYAATIENIQNLDQPDAKYAANPNFFQIGNYASLANTASLDAKTVSYDALQVFRYAKYLDANARDRKTGLARALYGNDGERNFQQAEQAVAAARRYPDIKSKMAVIDALSNKTLAYDYEKRDFEAANAGLPTGTDDGGMLFNIFASAERTERSHLAICGDAALKKMDELTRAGVPADRVSVVRLHWTSALGSMFYHVVTLVKAEDGVYVLNNNGEPPTNVKDFFGPDPKRMRFVPEISFGAGGINIYELMPSLKPPQMAAIPLDRFPQPRPQKAVGDMRTFTH